MTDPRQGRPPGRRIQSCAAVAAALGFAVVAGCTGENLFTGPTLGSTLLGPTVEISAPAANAVIAPGDSVLVTAHVSSANGVSDVTFSGVFTGGATAFTSQTVTLSVSDTTISKYLKQAGVTTGGAKIIVEATDLLGGTGADTVSVTIGT